MSGNVWHVQAAPQGGGVRLTTPRPYAEVQPARPAEKPARRLGTPPQKQQQQGGAAASPQVGVAREAVSTAGFGFAQSQAWLPATPAAEPAAGAVLGFYVSLGLRV